MVNGFNRTFGNARFTIDAFVWVDVQHGFPLVETFDGANSNAVSISAAVAGLGHHVGHRISSAGLGLAITVRSEMTVPKNLESRNIVADLAMIAGDFG
jgi:hypothetical protein